MQDWPGQEVTRPRTSPRPPMLGQPSGPLVGPPRPAPLATPQTPDQQRNTQATIAHTLLENQNLERQNRLREEATASRANEAENVLSAIGEARGNTSGWSTGMGSYLSGIPATQSHNLSNNIDTITANVGFDRLQEMRNASPTGGALGQVSDFENRMLQSSLTSLQQSQSQEQFAHHLDQVELHYLNVLNLIGGAHPARDLEAARDAYRQVHPIAPPPGADVGGNPPSAGAGSEPGAPSGGAPQPGMDRTSHLIGNPGEAQQQLGDGATRLEVDPVLRGVGHHVGMMIARGIPDARIVQYLRDAGVDPSASNIGRILAYRAGRITLPQTPSFGQWRRTHPNQAYPLGAEFYTRPVPQTGVRRTMSSFANSPGGAYAANVGDGVTFGTLDNLTSDPTQARAGLEALRNEYPGSSIAGSVVGQGLAAAPLEGGAAMLGARGLWAARGADALSGAMYGAGSTDEGNRLVGALEGAGTSMMGGAVGRTATRGAGRVLTGARDAGTRLLASRGVPLTMGQMAGQGGVLGRTVRGLEDKLQSIPLLGDAIRARREAGLQAFNRATFDEALAPIAQNTAGTIAEQGVESARGATSNAYSSALNGVQVGADGAFVRDMRNAMTSGSRLHPETAEDFRRIVENQIAPELANGTLTGEGYQALRQVLRQERAAWAGKPRGHQYGQVLRQVEGSLESLVRRQAPGAVSSLNRADQAYARTRVVENAVAAGKNTGGVFTPAQLGTAAAANARRFGGNQATTQRPFFDLQRAGQDMLPSTVPNSGTFDRAAAGALIAAGGVGYGTGMISPEHAAMMAALGLPHTQVGQRTLQYIITHRPDLIRQAGEGVIRNQRVGGAIGRGAAIPTLPNYNGQ